MYDDENDPGEEVIPWNKCYKPANDLSELYPIEVIDPIIEVIGKRKVEFDYTEMEVCKDVSRL